MMLSAPKGKNEASSDIDLVMIGFGQWSGMLADIGGSAACVLHYLHDRHVGITPLLAREVAYYNTSGDGLWSDAAWLLMGAFEIEELSYHSSALALWHQSPLYVLVSRVVAPVVRAACMRVRTTICFGNVALTSATQAIDLAAYRSYEENLFIAVKRLLSKPEEMGVWFWRDAAESLYAAIMRRAGREAGKSTFGRAYELNNIDSAFMSLLRELEPDFSRLPRHRLPDVTHVARARRDRSGVRPKEGGVVGVRLSRSMEDVPDMLEAEYLVPRELLADKLMNGSFLVRHRPPLRRPRRDALIVGMMAEPVVSEAAQFVKAVWLHAAFRAALWLKASGFDRSELRWIERVGSSGFRSLRADLQTATITQGDIWEMTNEEFMDFYRALMWMPSITDRLTGETLALTAAGQPPEAGLAASYYKWIHEGFAQSWEGAPSNSFAQSASEFESVHVQVLLPDPSRGEDVFVPSWELERSGFRAALGLPSSVRQSLDLCLIPPLLSRSPLRFWSHANGRVPKTLGPTVMGDSKALSGMYAEAIGWLVQHCLAAVAGGR